MGLRCDTKRPPLEVYSGVRHCQVTFTKLPVGNDEEKCVTLILGFVTHGVRLEQVAVAW